MTTYQERFAKACKTNRFASYPLKQGPDSGYLAWDVRHVRDGEKVSIDGPFITEEEARVSADLLRGTFRGARAYQAIYDRIWNYDPEREQLQLDQALMSRDLLASGTNEIRIVPVIAGSKNGGLFQTVVGVVLIAAGLFITGGTLGAALPFGTAMVLMGTSMVIGGVVQMLSPVPKAPGQQDQASYLFNGAFNSTQQGLPVPVVYGKMLVGSSVVAVGTWAEAIPA